MPNWKERGLGGVNHWECKSSPEMHIFTGKSNSIYRVNFVSHKQIYGAPIVSLFYMLNICSIYVAYSFYISNICSVFQMFVPYFKYLFYISNIYSQFEIFVQYPTNLCYISNICCVLKWLYSLPSLFCTSISILCFKYSLCVSNIRSNCKIFILINIHFILIKVAY